jgi:predicted MFS family arabinose efflux permease
VTYYRSLSAAGFAATAISYGPARMGFGLYVPQFKESFDLSSSAVGVISSLGFLGFFLSLLVAQFLLNQRGPAWPVVAGLLCATLGLGVVTLAPNVVILTGGVFLGAASAGFAWTPFNNAVHRKVHDRDRPAALSAISTGTSIGIALAGLSLLAVVFGGLSWRYCWGFFTLASLCVLAVNWRALSVIDRDRTVMPDGGWRLLWTWRAFPLFAFSFVLGVVSSVFISFAADQASGAGGARAEAMPAAIYISYGICGFVGLATARLRGLLGLPWLLRVMMATGALSCALLGWFAQNWALLVLGAGLQGVFVMVTSAVIAFWSERLFPSLPSLSFTAALLATATGSVLGPALAGWVFDAFGGAAMFSGLAVLALAAVLLVRRGRIREEPVDG